MDIKDKCEHGYNGDCCCNCQHQLKVMCHPSNGNKVAYGFLEDPIKFGKGSINQQCGWACKGLSYEEGYEGNVVFSDREHGMCEMHCRRTPTSIQTI